MPPSLPPVAVIAGPTASGKSALALRLAEARNGLVINADASQCYADLRILSARPARAEMRDVPHALYGFLAADASFGAAQWSAQARAAIADAHRQGQLPILVGGTGLYLRALLNGIAPVPAIDPQIRSAVRQLSTDDLAEALAAEDAVMANRLNPADTQRLARALEVIRSSGRSLAEFQAATAGGIAGEVALDPVVVELDRSELARRCDARFDAMLAAGGIEEARRVAAMTLDPALPIMKAIGVPPLLAHLAGELSLAEAADRARLDTRRYAKRQVTWFRNQTPGWPRVQA